MIPKQQVQRFLGVSLGTFILVGLCTYIYLNHLNGSAVQPRPPSPTTPGPEPTDVRNMLEPLQEKMAALFNQDAYYFSLEEAKLYLESYYDYPLLFSVPLQNISSLDEGRIPASLRQQFAGQRIRLSEGAKLETKQRGSLWEITDQKPILPWALKFTLVREDERIDVYRNPRDFEHHQLEVDFATLYPDRYKTGKTDWSPIPWAELRRLYNEYVKEHSPDLKRLRFRLVAI